MPARAYSDDELLMLSGIQHFKFCPRQWALIYLEQQWDDNRLTIEGQQLHRNVDQPQSAQLRDGVLTLHSVAVASYALGLSGIADQLELTPTNDPANAIKLHRYPGQWNITPIEFKHGRPKADASDDLQLCAQAICLEEMYRINIPTGEIYYGQKHRRITIEFTPDLRNEATQLALQMHTHAIEGKTPPARYQPKCRSCSIKNLCMAEDLQKATTVKHYLKQLYI